jgi:hypothetical protein
MDAKDHAYFLGRAFQEQEAARRAECSQARERHEELAAPYRFRCSQGAASARQASPNDPELVRPAARQNEEVM